MKSNKKLVLIGSTINPVHLKNYYELIKDYFDEILLIGPYPVDFCACKTVDFSIRNPIKLIKNILKLKSILLAYQPSIVHVHQANSFGFITSLANRRKFPQVLTTWGDDVLIFPKLNSFYRHLTRTSLKYSDYITADAEIMRDSIHKFYKNVPVVVANFGIDISIEKVNIELKENIIYSNRLHESLYNIDKIIIQCSTFLKQNPTWKLMIAASGSLTEELKELAKSEISENQFEFVGFLNSEENKNNYKRAKIYLSIPSTDGTSVSLLEAMAFGCVPFLSNLAANKEWVTNGENGFIVEENELSEKLNLFKNFDSKKAIEINQKIIETKASKEINRKLFYAIYDKIFNN